MPEKIRSTAPAKFPSVNKFKDFYKEKKLIDTNYVAKKIAYLIQNSNDFDSKTLHISEI